MDFLKGVQSQLNYKDEITKEVTEQNDKQVYKRQQIKESRKRRGWEEWP